MLLWAKQVLFTKHLMMLLQFLFNQGINVSVAEVYRPPEMAMIDYQKHVGIIDSLHCKKLAADLIFHDIDGKYLKDFHHYEAAGKYWESLDPANRWGGRFSVGPCKGDIGHFERMDIEIKNPNGRQS